MAGLVPAIHAFKGGQNRIRYPGYEKDSLRHGAFYRRWWPVRRVSGA